MTTPGTGDPEIDRALADLMARTAGLEEASRLLEHLRGHGASADGQVRVETEPGQVLASLHIAPRAMRLGSEALADAIMEAVRRAEEDLAERTFTQTRALFDLPGG
jgi:DNA-binding protein YbaB